MEGNCTFVPTQMISIPIDDVIKDAPAGKVPMFLVTSINEPAENVDLCEYHGEYVYIKDECIYDPLTGLVINGLYPENLHFCRYIEIPGETI